jgi:type I restriction enzyme, S subunit
LNALKKYKFSELYEMGSGISTKPEQAGHGAPFCSFTTVFNNYFLPPELPDRMDTSVDEQETYSLKEGDVLLTRTSETLDELGMSSVAVKDYPKATFSGFLKRLRPTQTDVVYHKFLAFYLRSPLFRKAMNNNAVMTLRCSLNEQIFSYLDLLLPEFDQQKKIGDLLFQIYAKIELNQRINAELEGMAKLLYDYWFVQFDFPMTAAQAAALGKPKLAGHPYRASGGKMIYNETLKRDIPVGWKEKALDDICQSVRDSVDPADVDSSTPYVGLEHVPRRQFFLDAWESASSVKSLKSSFLKGDVLFGKLRPYFHKVVRVEMEGICTSELLVLRPRQPKFEALLGSVVFSDQFVESTSKQWGGAQMPRADWNRMKEFQLPLPPDELLKDFNAFVLPLWKLGGANQQQNQELSQLRDWLLPMLMNGEVRVG